MSENMFSGARRNKFTENKGKIERELTQEEDSPFIVEEVPAKDRISLTIDNPINEFLNTMCSITKMSKSETVNIILKDYISSNKHIREIVESDEELKEIHKKI